MKEAGLGAAISGLMEAALRRTATSRVEAAPPRGRKGAIVYATEDDISRLVRN